MDSTLYLLNVDSTSNSSCGDSIINSILEREIQAKDLFNFNKHDDVLVEKLLFAKFKAMECINLEQYEDIKE